MSKEKNILREMKNKEKKEKSRSKKNTKELKSILDWMHIQKIDNYGIYLKNGKKEKIVRGLVLNPDSLFLISEREKIRMINSLASAFDNYKGTIYFKIIVSPVKLHRYLNRFSEMLKTERSAGIRLLIRLQLEKMDYVMNNHNELMFYALIQENEDIIDDRLAKIKSMFDYAKLNTRVMDVTDYEAVVSQEFQNEYVNRYISTVLIGDKGAYENEIEKN